MAARTRPSRSPRWLGGNCTTNTSTNSRNMGLTCGLNEGDRILLVSSAEGAVSVSSITATNVTWTKIAESSLDTPKMEIWLGVCGASPSNSITVNWSGGSWGGIAAAAFEGIVGTVVGRADGTSNTMAAFTPPKDNCVVIFAVGQNTFGTYYSWFSGRYMQNFNPNVQSVSSATPGAYWATPPSRASVSGTAQRINGTTGTLRSITLAVI